MKIELLYLITGFYVGGAEKAMVRIISNIDKSKYNITVAALGTGDGRLLPELKSIGVKIENLRIERRIYFPILLFRLYKLIRKIRPEVLICSLSAPTILGRIMGKLNHIPVIINWEHSESFGDIFHLIFNRITCPFSDKVICDSEKVGIKVREVLHIPSDMVEIIPIGGINLSDYCYSRNHSNNEIIEVGTIGRLIEEKGYSYFIKAAKIISDRMDNVHFSIVGDGTLFSQHNQLINELSLQDKVRLLGFRRDIPELLSSWQIYVQPSLWEGLCITVAEAMASGLPIIASNVGGIPESVIDGYNGFLVPPGESEVLADKILKLIYEPELRIQMGRRSRELAEEKYSLDKMVKHIEEVIDTLIRDKMGLIWNEDVKSWK